MQKVRVLLNKADRSLVVQNFSVEPLRQTGVALPARVTAPIGKAKATQARAKQPTVHFRS